jgi:hypothetical protein
MQCRVTRCPYCCAAVHKLHMAVHGRQHYQWQRCTSLCTIHKSRACLVRAMPTEPYFASRRRFVPLMAACAHCVNHSPIHAAIHPAAVQGTLDCAPSSQLVSQCHPASISTFNPLFIHPAIHGTCTPPPIQPTTAHPTKLYSTAS